MVALERTGELALPGHDGGAPLRSPHTQLRRNTDNLSYRPLVAPRAWALDESHSERLREPQLQCRVVGLRGGHDVLVQRVPKIDNHLPSRVCTLLVTAT